MFTIPKGKNSQHGAYAQKLMLWSEKFEDYELLRAALVLEISPTEAMELGSYKPCSTCFIAAPPRMLRTDHTAEAPGRQSTSDSKTDHL